MKAVVPVVIKAEQALLGAVMSDPAGQAHVLDLVDPDEMTRPYHGQVLAARQRLRGSGTAPGQLAVYAEIKKDPDHLHEEPGKRGHTMTWQLHTEDPECATTWDGTCTDCVAGASAFAGGSSSTGLGKVARDVDCSGPCAAWQNDMIAGLQHKRMSGAVAEYGQALRDISDRQWLADQGIDREAGE